MLRNWLAIFVAFLVAGVFSVAWGEENSWEYPCKENSWNDECKEFVELNRELAEQGNAEAQFNLGWMYGNGEGVEENKQEAAHWYRKSAEQGNAQAQKNLGVMYYDGEGVKKDKREAVRWFRKSAEQGHTGAQNNLGAMYANGEGVGEDKREAFRWFRKSAEQGDAGAQYNLGLMYAKGEGVVESEYEAYIWFLIARANGSAHADKKLRKAHKILTAEEIKSAKREASKIFEVIENRRNNAESSNSGSSQSGGEFAVAKPPEQTDVAAQVFENTWRSIVMIEDSKGQGSGVIIRPNMVATNCHVVEGGNIVVYKANDGRIDDNTPLSAKVIHRNDKDDFCVLEVNNLWGIAALVRKYETLQVGENVYALGAPKGLDMSLSNGLISQLRRNEGTRYIQTDAAISPGSSGGGLFDKEGNFIGILTSKYVDESTEGIGFAIPADLILDL